MKKTFLLFSIAVSSIGANAQLTLTGTSYLQNFNGIGTSPLPSGWSVYTDATNISAGTIAAFNNSANFGIYADSIPTCIAKVRDDGFKNYPSANPGAGVATSTCAAQPGITDRALGIRQIGTGTTPPIIKYDPGAAFVLKLTNTTGRTGFAATFKLQSLDYTCPRVTTWAVDYATGTAPTSFTPATTTGTMTTGGLTFSNNTVTVNFGTALDNIGSTVWIRVVALTASSGSGTRTSTAIDDFNLTWTGNPTAVGAVLNQPVVGLTVLGDATSDKVTFGYNVEEAGNYSFSIYDLTGRTIRTEVVAAKSGDQQLTLSGLNLASGLYIAKMNNGNSSAVAKFTVN